MPSDHGGDVLAVIPTAHSGQHPPCTASCRWTLPWCWCGNDGRLFIKIKIYIGPAAAQLGCVALLGTGSPHIFINTHTLESMNHEGAAPTICQRHTPPRSLGGFGKSSPLQSSAAVRSSVQLFHNDQPPASLAVWACVVPSEGTCYSDATAGCGTMTARTVRWLPAREMLVFS